MASQNKKIKQLISDLFSANKELILKAIKGMYEHGSMEVIAPIMELWRSNPTDEIEQEIIKLLESLKDTACIEPLIDAFRNDKNETLRRKMVEAFWKSKFDFSPYMADFVLFASEGDFLDAFEVSTLIDNFEKAPLESSMMETQLILKEYFGQNQKREEKKDALLAHILSAAFEQEGEGEFDDFYFEE
jgi:hypothetical protein